MTGVAAYKIGRGRGRGRASARARVIVNRMPIVVRMLSRKYIQPI